MLIIIRAIALDRDFYFTERIYSHFLQDCRNRSLLTYLLTDRSGVLEKLRNSQLVKKFPAFYATQKFIINAFTDVRFLSLSWTRSKQSMPPHPISWRYIWLLCSFNAWVFQVVSLPHFSPPPTCMHLSSPLYVLHATRILLFSIWSHDQYSFSSTDH